MVTYKKCECGTKLTPDKVQVIYGKKCCKVCGRGV